MGKNAQFQKFINQKSNAAKKEAFKQEKRAAKKERAAAIEKRFEEKRRMREAGVKSRESGAGSSATGHPKRKFGQPETETGSQPSKRSTPDSRLPTPDSRLPTPGSRLPTPDSTLMPLNKYIAHSGICSRRDAAELVKQGDVKVNNQPVTEPGTKISPQDIVTVKGKKISLSRNLVYILLNKPKDYITTLDDPEGRKTVLDLVRRATDERIYPVGRLDRNTSGVLLLTNDGELAQTLSHPKHEIKKIYEVRLDKPLAKADFEQLMQGLTLEDGFIMADALGYADAKDKSVIGIEIHSGRNRIVRRMFEHLGYDVRGLDRVMYAGLTKKNVQRGKWRFLTEKEIRILRHFNPQTKKTKSPAQPPPKGGAKDTAPSGNKQKFPAAPGTKAAPGGKAAGQAGNGRRPAKASKPAPKTGVKTPRP